MLIIILKIQASKSKIEKAAFLL